MSLIELLLIAIALGMDCFTVSLTCGILQRRMGWQAMGMATLFGLFQGMMLLIGWAATSLFSQVLASYDHWIAFLLLSFLGVNMIREGRKPACERRFDPSRLVILLMLAVATSIDALAVGCSFIAMGVRSWAEILLSAGIVGLGSFVLSLFGKYIGIKMGNKFNWPASEMGGAILIIIGIKVLITHLWS